MNKIKRILSSLLAIIMILTSIIPVSIVKAEELDTGQIVFNIPSIGGIISTSSSIGDSTFSPNQSDFSGAVSENIGNTVNCYVKANNGYYIKELSLYDDSNNKIKDITEAINTSEYSFALTIQEKIAVVNCIFDKIPENVNDNKSSETFRSNVTKNEVQNNSEIKVNIENYNPLVASENGIIKESYILPKSYINPSNYDTTCIKIPVFTADYTYKNGIGTDMVSIYFNNEEENYELIPLLHENENATSTNDGAIVIFMNQEDINKIKNIKVVVGAEYKNKSNRRKRYNTINPISPSYLDSVPSFGTITEGEEQLQSGDRIQWAAPMWYVSGESGKTSNSYLKPGNGTTAAMAFNNGMDKVFGTYGGSEHSLDGRTGSSLHYLLNNNSSFDCSMFNARTIRDNRNGVSENPFIMELSQNMRVEKCNSSWSPTKTFTLRLDANYYVPLECIHSTASVFYRANGAWNTPIITRARVVCRTSNYVVLGIATPYCYSQSGQGLIKLRVVKTPKPPKKTPTPTPTPPTYKPPKEDPPTYEPPHEDPPQEEPTYKIYAYKKANDDSLLSQYPDKYDITGCAFEITGVDNYYSDTKYVRYTSEEYNGSNYCATFDGLKRGTYKVREVRAGKGFRLNSSWSTTLHVPAYEDPKYNKPGEKLIYWYTTCTNEVIPPTGTVKLLKVSSNTSITNGNSAYSLEGAVYGVYKDESYNNLVDKLVTNVNGESNILSLEEGTYYVKELQAPKGYELDTKVKSIDVVAGKNIVINAKDKPKNDPVEIFVRKIDSKGKQYNSLKDYPSGNASLSNAEYTIKYYGEQSTPIRQWVIRTNQNGHASLSNTFKVSGDDFYLSELGKVTIPMGKVTVQETKAPKGYKLNPKVIVGYIVDTKTIRWENNDNSSIVSHNTPDAAFSWEEVIKGSLELTKIDKENTKAQGDATLSDTEFNLININDNPVVINEQLIQPREHYTFKIGETNKITINDLPYGRYRLEEVKAGKGYNLNSYVKEFSIENDGQMVSLTSTNGAINEVIKGNIEITKKDIEVDEGTQGNGKFKNISFKVVNNSKAPIYYNGKIINIGEVVRTAVIDKKDGKVTISDLPYGTYKIYEYLTNTSYLKTDKSEKVVSIRKNNETVRLDTENNNLVFSNKIKRGGVRISKSDSEIAEKQGDTSLAGAEFSIINKSKNKVLVDGKLYEKDEVVKVITTNEKGIAETSTDTLPYGAYEIKETKAPKGYLLNEKDKRTFEIKEDKVIVDLTKEPVKEQVIRGDVEVQKFDKELSLLDKVKYAIFGRDSQGNGDLSGIEFSIVNKSENPVFVGNKKYTKGQKVMTIITKYDGEYVVAKTENKALPYGTYGIQETKTNKSYLLTDGQEKLFEIREDGQVVKGTVGKETDKLAFYNKVVRGGVRISKSDSEITEKQGDTVLLGAEFSIINKSKNKVLVDGKLYAKDEVVKVITTNEKGIAETSADDLPYGAYEIKETKAPKGYLLNEKDKRTFEITEDKVIVDLTKEPIKEQVIRGGLRLIKTDRELQKSITQGRKDNKYFNAPRLEGARFNLINASEQPVMVKDKIYKKGEIIAVFEAKKIKDGYGFETEKELLPYGTYKIVEHNAGKGYNLSEEEQIVEIRENGKIHETNRDDKPIIISNQVMRGDFYMVKIAEITSRRLSVPFKITNLATGESHIFVTDVNGEFSSKSTHNLHTKHTNENDYLLKKIENNKDYIIRNNELHPEYGIWFKASEEKDNTNANDDLGALQYGDYKLEELRSENNLGYDLQSINITVYKDNQLINVGTVTNLEGTPTIVTKAYDSETKEKTITSAYVTDTVHLTNLVPNEKYTVETSFVDKETGKILAYNGKEIKGQTEFTATKTIMDIEIKIPVGKQDDKVGVVFERLLRNGKEVANHSEINDNEQTVDFPKTPKEPPKEEPPKEEPPRETPKEEPPKEEPPRETPKEEPPKEQPPTTPPQTSTPNNPISQIIRKVRTGDESFKALVIYGLILGISGGVFYISYRKATKKKRK